MLNAKENYSYVMERQRVCNVTDYFYNF